MTFEIPHIRVRAQYRSSGVLILVRASGAGDYWGEYGNTNHSTPFISEWFYWSVKLFKGLESNLIELFVFFSDRLLIPKTDGVRAKIYFKAVPVDQQDGLTYLRVEEAKMDFSVKNIQMGVDNVAGGNSVIRKFKHSSVYGIRICETNSKHSIFFPVQFQRPH